MSIPRTLRFRVLARDGFACRYCGRKAPDVALEVDHKHPRRLGGDDTEHNLVSACFDCNRGKRARLLPLEVSQERSHRATMAVGWMYGTLEMMGEYGEVEAFDLWIARDLSYGAVSRMMQQTIRWIRETPHPRPKATDYLRELVRAHRYGTAHEARCG